MTYRLPTHPEARCADPLGICDEENPAQSKVLEELLRKVTTKLVETGIEEVLPDLIQDIAYSLHGNGNFIPKELRRYLYEEEELHPEDAIRELLPEEEACLRSSMQSVSRPRPRSTVSAKTLQVICFSALRMSELFPSNELPLLAGEEHESPEAPRSITLTGAQVNCLLAHQTLGTLSQPPGNTWGLPNFTSWYSGASSHTTAVQGYMETIFHHFAHKGYSDTTTFTFNLATANEMPDPSTSTEIPNFHLSIIEEETEPWDTPFILVATHSQPGPGPTATQEERLQSASPALSISALVTPKIAEHAAVITSEFPVHAMWEGHNRTAKLRCLYPPDSRPLRNYILADALQLDDVEVENDGALPDLRHANIWREVGKLYAAFKGAAAVHQRCISAQTSSDTENNNPVLNTVMVSEDGQDTCHIEAGAWGCGAFGGSVPIKAVCMMIAAGLAGVSVTLTLVEGRSEDIIDVRRILERGFSVRELWGVVTSEGIRGCKSSREVGRFFENWDGGIYVRSPRVR